MAVLMLLTMLGLAVLGRSHNQVGTATRNSDAAAAEAGAEQGIAEALARIDAGQRASFQGTGTLADGTYRYEATATGPRSFTIYGEATVGVVVRAIDAGVGGRSLYPYTMFVDGAASFDRNVGAITGRVGTNGPIDVVGSPPGDEVDLFGPAASCSACAVTTSFDEVREVASPSPTGDTFQPCPADGIFGGAVDGGSGTPIVCDLSATADPVVRFTGSVVVVDGPLVIHVLGGTDVEITDATINGGGSPADFQLMLGGTDDVSLVSMVNSRVDGIIYAPGRASTAARVAINGSLTVGSLTVASTGALSVAPSSDVEGHEVSGWQISSWQLTVPR